MATCNICKPPKEFETEADLTEHNKTAHADGDLAPNREHRFWRRKGE